MGYPIHGTWKEYTFNGTREEIDEYDNGVINTTIAFTLNKSADNIVKCGLSREFTSTDPKRPRHEAVTLNVKNLPQSYIEGIVWVFDVSGPQACTYITNITHTFTPDDLYGTTSLTLLSFYCDNYSRLHIIGYTTNPEAR